MSLWITGKSSKQARRTEITTVPSAELVLFGAMFAVLFVSIVSASLAFGPPKVAAAVIYGLLGLGMVLFLLAKVSVIRRGHRVSFGSGKMSTAMRRCYRLGYALCALGFALALGTFRWWAAV
jgi:hypothetical protein